MKEVKLPIFHEPIYVKDMLFTSNSPSLVVLALEDETGYRTNELRMLKEFFHALMVDVTTDGVRIFTVRQNAEFLPSATEWISQKC